MKPRSLSDEEVWNAFRQGDEAAFEELYRRYHPVLLRYGRRLLHDDEAIRDCIHDLFLKLHGYRATLRAFDPTQNPDSVRFYLFSSLKNGVISRQGQQERAGIRAQTFDQTQEGFVVSMEEAPIQTELSNHQTQQLRRALGLLPPRQQEAIHLRYFEGLGVQQVSELMGLNYQSACNVLSLGLKKLAQLIGISTTLSLFLPGMVLPFASFFLKKVPGRK